MTYKRCGLITIILSWISFVLAGAALSMTTNHYWFFIALFLSTGGTLAFITYTLTRNTDVS